MHPLLLSLLSLPALTLTLALPSTHPLTLHTQSCTANDDFGGTVSYTTRIGSPCAFDAATGSCSSCAAAGKALMGPLNANPACHDTGCISFSCKWDTGDFLKLKFTAPGTGFQKGINEALQGVYPRIRFNCPGH
ncbi:hypothetical protein Tdes44962_MAKER04550 [Teratosphaeria destructans]|uniref:Uncharacterized protein n=1 Tax=Teratosphaeria destructans TaxID=418781 RepID=A0A9W7SMS8_9PEZI|nr:hypothetical protein Tdes44962_MAKER04550 [Teratosphaeria destructans]